jgi:hypothetical protein
MLGKYKYILSFFALPGKNQLHCNKKEADYKDMK